MTILEKEIKERAAVINGMGYLIMAGLVDITADNESLLQTAMTAMIVLNEREKKELMKNN